MDFDNPKVYCDTWIFYGLVPNCFKIRAIMIVICAETKGKEMKASTLQIAFVFAKCPHLASGIRAVIT